MRWCNEQGAYEGGLCSIRGCTREKRVFNVLAVSRLLLVALCVSGVWVKDLYVRGGELQSSVRDTRDQAQAIRSRGRESCIELCTEYAEVLIASLRALGISLAEMEEHAEALYADTYTQMIRHLRLSCLFFRSGIWEFSDLECTSHTPQSTPHVHPSLRNSIGNLLIEYSEVQRELMSSLDALLQGDGTSWWSQIRRKESYEDIAEKLKKLITEERARAARWTSLRKVTQNKTRPQRV